MAKELDSKNLLDCISLKDESDAAKFAADKCFELFDNRHRGALRQTVKMWCKKYRISGDLREDIVQEVLLIVYENAGDFKAEPDKIGKFDKLQAQVQAWLGGIALNKVRHIQRARSREINIGDIINPEQGDDISVEDVLDSILEKTKRLVDRMLEAEENAYGVTPKTESEPEDDERARMMAILKKCADEVLKERERDILYAAVNYYFNEKERIKAMKEVEDKHTISADNRRTILKRSLEKIKKCLNKQK
jgi:RNA polymerase sigma factor (sigma-70 family)